MAAAASESFSGRLDTEVTSIFIRASRSMSMTLVEEEAVGWSAALAERSRLNPAKSAAPAFHLSPYLRAGLFSAPQRMLDELFMMCFQLAPVCRGQTGPKQGHCQSRCKSLFYSVTRGLGERLDLKRGTIPAD